MTDVKEEFIELTKRVREAKHSLRDAQHKMKEYIAEHFTELHKDGLLKVQPNWYEIYVRQRR